MEYREALCTIFVRSRAPKAKKYSLLFKESTLQACSRTPRVLIAEDDALIKTIYQHFLSSRFTLTFVNNGKEALDILHKEIFDALLTDINMPETNGIELAKTLRNFAMPNAHIPIIGVSANAELYRNEALRAGMSIVLEKPIEKNTLLTYFNQLLTKTTINSFD